MAHKIEVAIRDEFLDVAGQSIKNRIAEDNEMVKWIK